MVSSCDSARIQRRCPWMRCWINAIRIRQGRGRLVGEHVCLEGVINSRQPEVRFIYKSTSRLSRRSESNFFIPMFRQQLGLVVTIA